MVYQMKRPCGFIDKEECSDDDQPGISQPSMVDNSRVSSRFSETKT